MIEDVWAESGDDTVIGNNSDNNLFGMDGDDRLEGGDGDDLLMGGNGADILNGGSGDDRLSGARGPAEDTPDWLEPDPGSDTSIFDHNGNGESDTVFGFVPALKNAVFGDRLDMSDTDLKK